MVRHEGLFDTSAVIDGDDPVVVAKPPVSPLVEIVEI